MKYLTFNLNNPLILKLRQFHIFHIIDFVVDKVAEGDLIVNHLDLANQA
jgi:hypothetical protein